MSAFVTLYVERVRPSIMEHSAPCTLQRSQRYSNETTAPCHLPADVETTMPG